MIPPKIHQIWLGPRPKPLKWMDTWQTNNPTMEYYLWSEEDIPKLRFDDRINYLLERSNYAGASDIMRVEILEQHGGVYIDSDSICLKPIQHAPFMATEFFVGWDYPDRRNIRPVTVANGMIGSVPHHPILKDYIEKHWLLGARMLTKAIEGHKVTILPTSTFYPRNWDGRVAPIDGESYAKQLWANTKGLYASPDLLS